MTRTQEITLRYWSTVDYEAGVTALIAGLSAVFAILGSLFLGMLLRRLVAGFPVSQPLELFLLISAVGFVVASMLMFPMRPVEIRLSDRIMALRGAAQFGMGLLRNPLVTTEASNLKGWAISPKYPAIALDLRISSGWWEPLERDGSVWFFVPIRWLPHTSRQELFRTLDSLVPRRTWPSY